MSAEAVAQQHRENVAHVNIKRTSARASHRAYRAEVERMMSSLSGTEEPGLLLDQYEESVRRLSRASQASIK